MKNFAWIIFSSFLISCPWGLAQSPNALGARNVQDYFQDVESKSYYQQERIRSMKGEMNEYSKRLHGLQEKFHKIFYGKSTDELHETPFGDRDRISYPKRKYRDPVPIDEVESIVRRPSKISKPQSESNQLAFTVDESRSSVFEEEKQLFTPVSNQSDKQSIKAASEYPVASRNQTSPSSGQIENRGTSILGGYLIIRPGVLFSHKDQTTHQGSNKTKHREYKPGVSVSLSGGYRYKNWNFGAGLLYRKNEHDSGSYERVGNQVMSFANGSESISIAGFLEVGYTHTFNSLFGIYSTLGLGYGLSVVEDFSPSPNGPDRTRLDPFLYASVGVGATFTPTDFLALSLGYRYFHEEEVPAHGLELGLIGKF